MSEEEDESLRVRCSGCGYEWETQSKHVKVSCPSCGKKVEIRESYDGEPIEEALFKEGNDG